MSFIECSDCDDGKFYKWNDDSTRTQCDDCKDKDDEDEFMSTEKVRCPKCKYLANVYEFEQGSMYEDGSEHNVDCGNCSHEFTFTTSVTYDFTSPELEDQNDN